jgi:cytochrome c biogenesis protein CcmG/thiol:disulfide interchange protein DsbE
MGRRPGVVRYAKAGSLNLEDLNRELIPLLNEPASAS